jgi:hypothetical protein
MDNNDRKIGDRWYDGCEYCIMTFHGVKRYDTKKELELDNDDDSGNK